MQLNLEVRINPLVLMWNVYADGPGTLNPVAFTNKAPGIFTYTQNVTPTDKALLVRFTIWGQGGNVQNPAGVCLVSFGNPPPPDPLLPHLIASIKAGHSADVKDYHYPIDKSIPSGVSLIPDFEKLYV